MSPEALRALLEAVRAGQATVDDVASKLAALPAEHLGFATVDHHRPMRQGFPEVIYGEGKSPAQIAAIARSLSEAGSNVLVTRVDANEFGFRGKIVTQVSHINGGAPCTRDGEFTFRATGSRKYWRLQQMDNPCDSVTDYVDVYFRR